MQIKLSLKMLSALVLFSLVFSLFAFVSAIEPDGASVTVQNNTRAPTNSAGSASAYAGNVSQLLVNGFSSTQTWQGYFGNVTGTIQLADGSGNVFYNWSLASPSGEIYSSTNQSISWTNVQCFNYTALGNYTVEAGAGGSTNLYGLNLTQLETRFNVGFSDVDGVDETFNLFGAGTHDLFYTANQLFSVGECRSTRVFDDTGAGVADKFEEVLLYEPVSTSVVFTALLEQNAVSFNDATQDFEMLVLEDGHGTDTAATTYYFFVELQ